MNFRLALPLWLEIALAILVALALSNAATFLVLRAEGEGRMARFGSDVLGQRVASAANVVLKAPISLRADLVRALTAPGLRLTLDDVPAVGDAATRETAMETAIASRLTLEGASVRVHSIPPGERATPRLPPPSARGSVRAPGEPPPNLIVSIAAGGGTWLNARYGMQPPRMPFSPWLWSAAALLGSLLLAALWIGRRVARPLQTLARAATALRRGELSGPVPETGPAPVREAARAFNGMSARVMTMLKSQRAMMAAVAHDLRTPISVMRFRVEMVSDEETRARLVETLDEMQGMTEAVLDAARVEGSSEAARVLDVASLVDGLCVDMAEVGGDVVYESDVAVTCECRPAEVRRAVRNLIENALRYGQRARASVEKRGDTVAVLVDDDGPGIPEGDLERVFEPFARLDESRSRETGGYGLGLAIARLVARGHGGDVTLANRDRGLRATLTLPLSADQAVISG